MPSIDSSRAKFIRDCEFCILELQPLQRSWLAIDDQDERLNRIRRDLRKRPWLFDLLYGFGNSRHYARMGDNHPYALQLAAFPDMYLIDLLTLERHNTDVAANKRREARSRFVVCGVIGTTCGILVFMAIGGTLGLLVGVVSGAVAFDVFSS